MYMAFSVCINSITHEDVLTQREYHHGSETEQTAHLK